MLSKRKEEREEKMAEDCREKLGATIFLNDFSQRFGSVPLSLWFKLKTFPILSSVIIL